MKKLYFIAIVLPEPLLSEIAQIKHNLSKKYKTYAALKSPAHITLISPFFYPEEREYELLQKIQGFKSPVLPFSITLKGFDCFPPRVIFINPQPSDDLKLLYTSFKDFIKDYLPFSKKISLAFHPHVTVANRDWSEFDFENAWNEYQCKFFQEQFEVSRIQLLKLNHKKWEILYQFQLVTSENNSKMN